MSKFRKGQKVIVVALKPSDGIPMKHKGKVVTISTTETGNPDWPYRIEEDKGWVWREDHFVDSKESDDPNIIFKLNRNTNL